MALIRLFQLQPTLPIDDLIDKLDHLRQEISGNLKAGGISSQSIESNDPPQVSRTTSDKSEPQPASHEGAKRVAAPSKVSPDDARLSLDEVWDTVYEQISQNNPSLAANLAKCSLKRITEDRIEIEVVGNGFTLNMIQRDKNLKFLKKLFADYFGHEKRIVLSGQIESSEDNQKKKSKNNQLKNKAMSHPLVADAIEIFDGKLVDVKIR
jgi:DNA polymerase-3 subunit gamma/tau